jgi:hypothetical protein
MRRRPKTFLRKCLVLGLVGGISISGSWLLSESWCLFQECIEDDASMRADALIGTYVLAAYIVLTLVAVFLPALALHRRLPKAFSAVIPAVAVSEGVLLLIFNWGSDSASDAFWLSLWLAVPWTIAALVGLALWPSRNAGAAGG